MVSGLIDFESEACWGCNSCRLDLIWDISYPLHVAAPDMSLLSEKRDSQSHSTFCNLIAEMRAIIQIGQV